MGPRICTPTVLPQLASAPPNKTTCSSRALLLPPRNTVTYFAPNSFSCASHSKMPSPSCTHSAGRQTTSCTSSLPPAVCLGWVPSSWVGPRSRELNRLIGRCQCSWSGSPVEMGTWGIFMVPRWAVLLSRLIESRLPHLAYSQPPGALLTGNCIATSKFLAPSRSP